MSTESENNFINELKFDVLKDKVKKFVFTYLNIIVSCAVIVLFVIFVGVFINFYKNNKIESYNEKIFLALDSNNKIEELEKIYNDKSAPRISKTFTGLKLIEELVDNDKIKNIYLEIFENEKEIFFKNYAGLNLLVMAINEENMNDKNIAKLLNDLDNGKNPLQDMVLEQKIIFLVKQGNKGEARTILNNLVRKNANKIDVLERLNKYNELVK